jgi:hypothetical protein
MTSRSHHPLRRGLALVAGTAAAVAAFLALGTAPAQASTCATPGHAYVTKPGAVYLSGYDGDQRFGIPTINTYRGDTFRIGANGIRPLAFVNFFVVDAATGAPATSFFVDGGWGSQTVGSNCVLNEEGPFTISAPDGRYRIRAMYFAGNSGTWVTDQIADLVVSESNRPVRRPPPDPCLAATSAASDLTALLPPPC